MLGQQPLLDAPSRALSVPCGHLAHAGADLGTTRLALARIGPDGRRDCLTVPFPSLKGAHRLSEIHARTRSATSLWAASGPRIGVLMTEQPSGGKQAVNLPLIMAAGVILAGLFDGLHDAYGLPVEIVMTTSAHWKKVACGSGAIRKPGKGASQADYQVFRWALDEGWLPLDWNEADAAGMAECARREIALVER